MTALGAGVAALAGGLSPQLAHADDLGAESWLGYDARLRTLLDTPPGDGFQPAVEASLLAETNRYRAAQGAPRLSPHAGLDRVARAAAADMASRGFFDHHSPEGHAPSVRVGLLARELCGASGENIAYQQRERRQAELGAVVAAWRASDRNGTNNKMLAAWLRAAILNSMPGSSEPMPPAPKFAATSKSVVQPAGSSAVKKASPISEAKSDDDPFRDDPKSDRE